MSPLSAVQYVLPHRLISRFMLMLTRVRVVWFKNFLIKFVAKNYAVNWDEAASQNLADYPNFNAFFTRALRPNARQPITDPNAILMPADGRISQLGKIKDGRIFQAKGFNFTAAELLGDDELAKAFAEGFFVTVYLSPRDYHRSHMPMKGRLLETVHIPGRLFSVSQGTVANIPCVFARNERLACLFETDNGPMAVVMVGALNVSGIETVWRGEEVPPYASKIIHRNYRDVMPKIELDRFAEMARFNMGSTVIVLLPPDGHALNPKLKPGDSVCVGELLALYNRS